MKKVILIHLGKHHIYHSVSGIIKSNKKVKAYLAMYDNSNVFRYLLKKLGKEKYLKGYNLKEIDNYVETHLITKLSFLLSKYNNRLEGYFSKIFQFIALFKILRYDYVHVVQDYTNFLTRFSKFINKIVVYEQIIAPSFVQKRYLDSEIEKWGYPIEISNQIIHEKQINEEKRNLKVVDFIHVPSEFVRESVLNEIGMENNSKVVMWPYGVDVTKFQYKLRKYDSNKTLKLLCVSRVHLLKGTKYLIESMKLLQDSNVELTYIGKSLNEEFDSLVEEMKSIKNITYIESVPHSQMSEYYLNSDVFILPSLIEGSSLVVYEALSCGLPSLVTVNTGSVVTNGKDGFILETQSIDSIIETINNILLQPKVIENMSLEARKTAEKHSWNEYSRNFAEFYKNIT